MRTPLVGIRLLVLSLMFVAAVGTASVSQADTLTIMWDPSPDPVAGYMVYVGTQSGTFTQTFDVGNALSFVFSSAAPGQTYYFAVAGYAPGPVIGTQSAEVVGLSNAPPSLENPGSRVNFVGEPISLQVVGKDPDGKPVTFTATGLPPGLKIAQTGGLISGAGTTAGNYNVTVSVSDSVLSASEAFPWAMQAGAPQAAKLVSPTGAITTTSPKFVWNAVAGVTRYSLVVDDAGTTSPKLKTDYTPTQAGCAGTATCTVTPGVAFDPGPATWWVIASNTGGDATSAPVSFSMPAPTTTTPPTTIAPPTTPPPSGTLPPPPVVTAPVVPGAAQQIAPTGNIDTATPKFTWNAVATATLYRLIVNDSSSSSPRIQSDYTPTQAGCAGGGTCGVSPGTTLAPGGAKWWVITFNAASNTPTDSMSFTILSAGSDTDDPEVRITSPTTRGTYTSTKSTVTVGGTASDNVGVTRVTWVNNRGGRGDAKGTTNWSAAIALQRGDNEITITVRDAAGNTARDQIVINYDPRGGRDGNRNR